MKSKDQYKQDNASPTSKPPMLKGVKILVVDDAEDIREMVAFLLTKYGAKVQTAIDGAEAVAMTEKSNFDCILMDLRMPGLDGNDTARKIKTEKLDGKSHTVIIALTGEQNKSSLDSEVYPFDDWIFKPVKPLHLSKLIYDTLKSASH